jgi:hypothetical protein
MQAYIKPMHSLTKKLTKDNSYLQEAMPEKQFKYTAIASWFYNKTN